MKREGFDAGRWRNQRREKSLVASVHEGREFANRGRLKCKWNLHFTRRLFLSFLKNRFRRLSTRVSAVKLTAPLVMRILVAPDKFKGSLSATAAAGAISRGLRAVLRDAEIQTAAIADGGEGFAEALCEALGGVWVETQVQDALGREVSARYAWVETGRIAILEMSEASGLWRLKKSELAPLRANTFGTGQLLRHAVERGAGKILIGLGGSATTDGGIGMAAALGYNFLTDDGDDLAPFPGNLLSLIRIETEEAIELPEIVAACEVQNPLLGERGAARVFGPQKGADAKTVVALEEGLLNLADVVASDLGCDFRETPGAGAAGGIAYGLMSFCGARVCSGFEGRLDGQTLEGKGPAGVSALARKHGKPIVAFAGSVADSPGVHALFDAACAIIDEPVDLDQAMARGAEFLERAAGRAARLLKLGNTL
jgi:glycerate 2-kinase